jgi:hypothetical protein
MPKVNCSRKGCTRIRSEFSLFLSRRQPPRFEGRTFCSETCLREHIEKELSDRWYRLMQGKGHPIRRPKLGTILLQTAFITPDQLDTAIKMQRLNQEGKIGEWLVRLGFVEERQITQALSQQYGIPIIHLDKSEAKNDAVRLIPGKVAKCSQLIPLGLDEEKKSLCLALSDPVDFNSLEIIRRMVGRGLITYISDQSTVLSLLERWYKPEDLDFSGAASYTSQGELLGIGRTIVSSAYIQQADDIQMELAEDYFWARLDFQGRKAQQVYRRSCAPTTSQEKVAELRLAVASMGIR